MRELLSVKYKPNRLNDFDDSNDMITILKAFINIGNLSILLVGDSGSGKTTLIYSIIKEYYGSNISLNSDNILYINTLKEQGISYYRNDVKIFCQTSSTIPGKKKMLILDDLDVINEQSQQVFRNCIDKYSGKVLFLASCSNPQKIIDSIQSRMDIVRINAPSIENLRNFAQEIIWNENIDINPNVIDFVVKICNGSIRMLINYFEKFRLLNKHISLETAEIICTNIAFSELDKYTSYCINGNLTNAINIMNRFIGNGYSVTDILDSYFTYIKMTNLLSETQKYNIIPILCKYITIFHDVHEDELELIFFTNDITKIFNDKQNMYCIY